MTPALGELMVWPESGVLEPHLEFFTALVTVSFALPPRWYPVDCVCSLCTVECRILGLPLDVHGIGTSELSSLETLYEGWEPPQMASGVLGPTL